MTGKMACNRNSTKSFSECVCVLVRRETEAFKEQRGKRASKESDAGIFSGGGLTKREREGEKTVWHRRGTGWKSPADRRPE